MFTQDYSTPTFPKVDDEVCVTLRKVADEIRKRGWCRFTQKDEAGHVCVLGAFGYVEKGAPYTLNTGDTEATRALRDFVSCNFLSNWNNLPGRTSAEVIAALEGAADSRARALAGRK